MRAADESQRPAFDFRRLLEQVTIHRTTPSLREKSYNLPTFPIKSTVKVDIHLGVRNAGIPARKGGFEKN